MNSPLEKIDSSLSLVAKKVMYFFPLFHYVWYAIFTAGVAGLLSILYIPFEITVPKLVVTGIVILTMIGLSKSFYPKVSKGVNVVAIRKTELQLFPVFVLLIAIMKVCICPVSVLIWMTTIFISWLSFLYCLEHSDLLTPPS
jgi:hypothetical protein